MRKSRVVFLLLMTTIIAAGISAYAQQPASPPGTASVTFGDGKTVTINYSRPFMKGRKIFGGLVPYGQVWRTGANAATSLKTDVDLTVGSTTVPAGSYTLYTIPNEKGWTLIVNKQTGQWGTAYEQGQDLARVEMKAENSSTPVEQFTISLDKTTGTSATLKMEWANTVASVPVSEKK